MTRRAGVVVLLCAGLIGAAGPRVATAQAQGATPSRAVVELGVPDVLAMIGPAFRRGDEILLPLSPLMDSLGVAVRATRRGPQFRSPRGVDVLIDTVAGVVRDGSQRIVFSRGDVLVADDGVYVLGSLLGRLLGVRVVVDWGAARVTFLDGERLPAVRWAQAARERALRWRQLARSDVVPSGPVMPLQRPLLDGAFVDYVLSTPFASARTQGLYTVAGGANVAGGALDVATSGFISGSSQTTASWLGVWRDQSWLTQMRVGDAATTGPRQRAIRGISLTNAPYLRGLAFDRFAFPVGMPAGWELETAYNGVPVRVDTVPSDGVVTVPVPIRYGGNVVDFTAYGPRGQERRVERLVQLSASEVLPAQRFEYGLSGGACRVSACAGQGNLDLRYGVTRRFSVRGGVDLLLRDSGGTRAVPYATLSAQPTNALFVQAGGVAGFAVQALARWQPDLDRSIITEYARGSSARDGILLGTAGPRARWSFSGFARPSWVPGGIFGTANLSALSNGDVETRRGAFSLGIPAPGMQWSPFIARDELRLSATRIVSVQQTWGTRLSVVLPRSSGTRLASGSAFGTIEFGGVLQRSASLTWLQPIRDGMRLDVTASAAAIYRGPQVTVRLYTDAGAFRAVTSAVTGAGPQRGSALFLQGAAVLDRAAGRVALAPGPTLDRAGISGRVYLDDNANGVFDADDVPLAGVAVRIGTTSAITGANGRYRVWDVLAFEPVELEIDRSSLESPLWVVPTTTLLLQPGPNRFQRFDVGVIPGGVVAGVARAPLDDSLAVPVPGARVVLIPVTTGVRTVVPTFSDGSFQALGVAPGQYRIVFDTGTTRALRILADTTIIDVRAVPSGDRVGGVVVLGHRPAPMALPPIPVMPPVEVPRVLPPPAVAASALFRGQDTVLVLRAVTFQGGSAVLSPASYAILDAIALQLRAEPRLQVEVGGHTDGQGSAAANVALSSARAAVVRYYLVRQGVAADRLTARGYGASVPVASNATADGRATNRRVVLTRRGPR